MSLFDVPQDGLRVLPSRVRTQRDKTSPFTSPDSESGVSGLGLDTRDTAPLLDNPQDPSPSSPLSDPLTSPFNDPERAGSEVIPSGQEVQFASQETNVSDSESAASGYGTDTEAEEDIDAVVAEYQEKLRVATLNTNVPRAPTVATARRACMALAALLLTVVVAALVAVYGWQNGGDHPFLVVVLSASMVAALVLVAALTRLPTLRPAHSASFRVPAAPWLPAAALLLNVILLVQVLRHSWLVLVLYSTAGGSLLPLFICWSVCSWSCTCIIFLSSAVPAGLRKQHDKHLLQK